MSSPRFPNRHTEITRAGQLYLTWCHAQPLVLFNETEFLGSIHTRDAGLLLALQALSLRFPPDSPTLNQTERDGKAKQAHYMVHRHLAEGQVELSTLQALCILSMLDFLDCRFGRAELNLSTGSCLAQIFRANGSESSKLEFTNCVRSIAVLERLQGAVLGSSVIIPRPYRADHDLAGGNGLAEGVSGSQMTSSLLACVANHCNIWYRARLYAARRPQPNTIPPWMPHSDYSEVMMEHLELDSIFPTEYRYHANKFSSCTLEVLQERRAYWTSFLFLQIVWAGIPCLLNHPYLLSMRLRDFHKTMPQSFMQQSYEQVTRHSGWIMHFLDLLQESGFCVPDPEVAHCVAVVATIHLQHSFVQDKHLSESSKTAFEACMKFLRLAGRSVPLISAMAENLEELRSSVVLGPQGLTKDSKWSIDSRLLNSILVFETAGRRSSAPDQSLHGETLYLETMPNFADDGNITMEYDLIGSSGISGHRTNVKEVPLNAPSDMSDRPAAEDQPGKDRLLLPNVGESPATFSSGAVSGIRDDLFQILQGNEYGTAIDDWFNMDFR